VTRWTQADVDAYQRRCGKVTPKPAKPKPQEPSALEVLLERQLAAHMMQGYAIQFVPLYPRKWRLDYCWPEKKIGIEVQGMVHRIKGKFKRDIEKRAELMLAGWRVLEVDGDSIRNGRAIAWLGRLLTT
jgi:very-short-patch-repair endonuclease